MAKKIWCYTLSVEGVTGLLDAGGVGDSVAKPLRYHLYECMDDNADLAEDGTRKLYHAPSGVVDPADIADKQLKYNSAQPVQATFSVTCGTDGDGWIGYGKDDMGSIDHTDFDGVEVVSIDSFENETWVAFDAKPLHMQDLLLSVGGTDYPMIASSSASYSSNDPALAALFINAAVLTIVLDDGYVHVTTGRSNPPSTEKQRLIAEAQGLGIDTTDMTIAALKAAIIAATP